MDKDFGRYRRELDIATGIARTDFGLLSVLCSVLETSPLAYSLEQADEYFQNVTFVYYDPVDEVNKYLTRQEGRDWNNKSAPEVPHGLMNYKFGEMSLGEKSKLEAFSEALMLLARVVRNSELLPDVCLKAAAIEAAVRGYSLLSMSGYKAFEGLLNGQDNPESQASFDVLDEKEKGILENFLKCATPIALLYAFYDGIGTRLLGKIIDDSLENRGSQWLVQKFMLLGTLLLMVYLDGYSGRDRVVRKLRDLVDDNKTKPIHLYILLGFLQPLYNNRGLTRAAQDELLPILADIQLAIAGIRPGPQSAYGSLRPQLMTKIRTARTRGT